MDSTEMTVEWISVKDRMPEYNISVLVFIPGENDHCTTGMWDISNKWVLLDEYRVPREQVTYWAKMVELPEDRSYVPCVENDPEEDKMIYELRELRRKVYDLETKLHNINS